jgi:hypothetical protein
LRKRPERWNKQLIFRCFSFQKSQSLKGYFKNWVIFDFTWCSQICFSWSYKAADILWKHMFSTAWYSSSKLDFMERLVWMACTDSENLWQQCTWCSSKMYWELGGHKSRKIIIIHYQKRNWQWRDIHVWK